MPILLAPRRFFYGWTIVGVTFVVNILASSLSPVAFSFFVTKMSDDLDVSKGTLSWALSLRMVGSGLAAPLVGILVDRLGARWLGTAGALIGGVAIILLGGAHSLWMVYLLFAVSGAVGLGGGPGGNLLTLVPVAKWFITKRGRAMAISTTGAALGTVILIPLAAWLLDGFGWRTGWVVFGIALACAAPLFALFMLRSPEDIGLNPDGATVPYGMGVGAAAGPVEVQWTIKEALRTPALWLALGAFALMGLALNGTLVYRVDYWKGEGLSSSIVAFATTMDPFTVIFSCLFFGIVAERMSPRHLGFIGCGIMALSVAPMIIGGPHAYLAFLNMITWGIGAGAFISVSNVLWPAFYGRKFLGTLRGLILPITIAVAGVSAPLYGYVLDAGLNPKILWTFTLGIIFLSGLLLLAAKAPKHKSVGTTTTLGTAAAVS